MTAFQIEAVIVAQSVLIDALDAGDVGRIETATSALARLLDEGRAGGRFAAADHSRVEHALRQGEAARMRVNYLADRTRQKRERLSEIRGGPRPALYGASGQLMLPQR